MLDESMFEDIHEIAENSAYLKAVEQKDVSLEMLEQLPPYEQCRDIEERLRAEQKLSFDSIFNEPTGFYMIKCFAADTRVLTDRGFLFIDELEALVAASVPLRFAAFDSRLQAISYVNGQLRFPAADGRLISFTHPAEALRWRDGSGDYGDGLLSTSSARLISSSSSSNGLSLRVTGEHEMYVQTAQHEYSKVRASDLLASCSCSDRDCRQTHSNRSCRMLAHARAGLHQPDAQPPAPVLAQLPAVALGLDGAEQLDAFLELYGFWLGVGSLQRRLGCNGCNAVTFPQRRAGDVSFLADRLSRVALQPHELRLDCGDGSDSSSSPISTPSFQVLAARWFDYFDAEYGCDAAGRQKTAAAQQTDSRFWWWTLRALDARQVRLVLAGLHRASGSDCGFSAYFDLQQRAGDVKGSSRLQAEDERDYTTEEAAADPAAFRAVVAGADCWRVCYCFPDSGSSAASAACAPTVESGDGVVSEEYSGRVWCVTVQHADHLIFAQRAHRSSVSGVVTKASRPVIVGQCFLIADYAVDKAIFIKDVEAYKSMRFESARRKVAALLYQRFVSTEEQQADGFKHGMSVFQIIQQSKGAEEKKERDGKVQPASINLSASPSNAASVMELKSITPQSVLPQQSAAALPNLAANSNNGTNGHGGGAGGGPLSGTSSAAGSTFASPHLLTLHLNGHPSPAHHPPQHGGSLAAPPITPSSPSHAASTLLQMGNNNNTIGVYGKSVRIVREKVSRGEAPKELFDEVARDVMTDLKLDAFPRFKQGEFYRRYIRTKWIETQKVQVKDFTTFRVLGRGGFGAVHACRKKNSGQIYAMKCFPADDMRVLTNRGFLFLDELQAAIAAGGLTFASYDVSSDGLVYGPGELLLPPGERHRLINVTPAAEQPRWATSSDCYGRGLLSEQSYGSNHLSLRVTAEHDLYVQSGSQASVSTADESICWSRCGGALLPPSKVEAGALLQRCRCPEPDCRHRRAHARFLGAAAAGLATDESREREVDEQLVAALGITAAQVDFFLELYGFWLVDGDVQYGRHGQAVIFPQLNSPRLDWLRVQLAACGLQEGSDWRFQQRRGADSGTVCLSNALWFAFFDKEYGSKYACARSQDNNAAGSVAAAEATAAVSVSANCVTGSSRPTSCGIVGLDADVVTCIRCQQRSTALTAELCIAAAHADTGTEAESPGRPDADGGVEDEDGDGRRGPGEWTKAGNWFMPWALHCLGKQRLQLLVRGLQRADGSVAGEINAVLTSSARFRDELMVALLHAGYSAYFELRHEIGAVIGYSRIGSSGSRIHSADGAAVSPHRYRPVTARSEVWRVQWSASSTLPGRLASRPVVRCHDGVKVEEYRGRIWCVTVQHRDHLIIAQRAHRDQRGVVTKASLPVVIGQCINKKLVKVKSALDNVLEERNVLTMMKSHFVTNLKYGLQDEDTLFLIMDLMLGGDLKFHLINAGRFTEKRARFYAAQVLLGLEHVHRLSIIYRDMKLENVLLDHSGNCRLSDLGLAVVTKVKIKGYAGTPGYTAPEMIKNKLYGPAADIFSYGVMLYRMLCGSKPFKGKVDRDLDKAVIERKPTFPKEIFSKEAISLLTGLLQKRPENRLGCGERGIDEIKDHAFFESIDWGLLEAGYIDPPFVPNKFDVNAASLKDIGDFDRAKYKHVKLDDRFKQRIKNFEYVNVRALQDEMVQVLEKADEHINFEKFAQQPAQQTQPQPQSGPACCVLA